MNLVGVIIIVVLSAHFIVNWMADLANLSAVSPDIPDDFVDVYDADTYATSQNYLRAGIKLDRFSETFDFVLFMCFWGLRGFALLDHWVRSLGLSPVLSGIVYIGVLATARGLLHLPFSLYATFVIEERFGFNRTTWRLFIIDRIKALGVGVLLGVPLLAGIIAFFEYAGDLSWLWCWGVVTGVLILMQIVVPTWIMPLFNRFTPPEDEALKQAILAYARNNNFPLANVFVMDGSRRSAKSNAFFAGWGKRKRLVLFDTMIKNHSIDEIVAIVAHEVGHYRKKHLLTGMVSAILQTGFMFYLLSLFLSWEPLFEAFFVSQPSVYAGLVFFGVLYTPVDFFIGLLMQQLSRRHEFAADRFAVETTGEPGTFIHALKRLSVDNLSNLRPHPLYVLLHYSHPPISDRIAAIRRLAD